MRINYTIFGRADKPRHAKQKRDARFTFHASRFSSEFNVQGSMFALASDF